jgi:glycosyltransferase involved in cell wall biosynthesis
MGTLSIVSPIFNKQNEIKRLYDSIGNDDRAEFIPVDDCSQDNSRILLRQLDYDSQNTKAILLPENMGVHFARNIGLVNSTNEWICFIDGDDYFLENGIDTIIRAVQESKYDVNFFPYLISNTMEPSGFFEFGEYSESEFVSEKRYGKYIFKQEKDVLAVVKRDFLLKNKILWRYINLDYTFRNELLHHAKKCYFHNIPVAIYDKNQPNSLGKTRKRASYILRVAQNRFIAQFQYLQDYTDYFSNDKVSAKKYLKRMLEDYKVCETKLQSAPKLIRLFIGIKAKNEIWMRFFIFSILPYRFFYKYFK